MKELTAEHKGPLQTNLQLFAESADAGESTSEDSKTNDEPFGEATKTNNDATKTNTEDNKADEESKTLEKLVQSAVDRATNKLGNENKKLREQLETIKKEKMSDEEIKNLELADKEAEIADREAKLLDQENRFYAIKAIKAAGLDTGNENALNLIDFVMGKDENEINEKVKAFGALVNEFVKSGVDKTFKDNGRIPNKSNTNGESNVFESVGVQIAKTKSENDAKSQKVINHYLGGK